MTTPAADPPKTVAGAFFESLATTRIQRMLALLTQHLQAIGGITGDYCIRRNQRETFHDRLRNQRPVERVLMEGSELRNLANMVGS